MIRPIPTPIAAPVRSGSKVKCILFSVVEIAQINIVSIKLGYVICCEVQVVSVNLTAHGTRLSPRFVGWEYCRSDLTLLYKNCLTCGPPA